jgi:hypothetical protein
MSDSKQKILTERERLVLAWDKDPEEWYAEHGGQYGAELVDAERKLQGRCIGCRVSSGQICGGCGAFVNDGWDGNVR